MAKMERSDKIAIASTLIAFFGFLLVIWQINTANEQIKKTEINQRAQFLAALQDRAFGSTDFQEIFRKLEYGQVNVDAEFHGSKEQTQMVALLSCVFRSKPATHSIRKLPPIPVKAATLIWVCK